MSISTGFSAIRSWNVSRSPKSPKKIHKNPYFRVQGHPSHWIPCQSRASVIQLPISDYSRLNLSFISHRYWNTATFWLKIANFSLPPSHLAPSFEWPPLNLWKSFTVPEIRVFQAADGEDLVILACTVFDWSTHVPYGQTDGDRIAMAKTR